MSDAMSLDGVHASDETGWQELYNNKQSSTDMELILPGPKCKTIYAHKRILAAESGLLDGVARNADTFELRKDYSPDSYEFVLKYMYGYRFEGLGGYAMPHTLHKLAEVAEIAKLWEVNGLLWLVTEAADRFLVESLDDEYKLQEFLYIQTWKGKGRGRVTFPLAHKILGMHLAELNKSPSFRRTIEKRPDLAVKVVLAVGYAGEQ